MFFLILMVLLPGFSLALGVLGVYHDVPGPAPSAATARPGDAQLDFSRLQALQLVLLMMGSGDWESAEVDWMANGVFVLFLFMSPVLALNILVAMMADTYARVTEQVRCARPPAAPLSSPALSRVPRCTPAHPLQ